MPVSFSDFNRILTKSKERFCLIHSKDESGRTVPLTYLQSQLLAFDKIAYLFSLSNLQITSSGRFTISSILAVFVLASRCKYRLPDICEPLHQPGSALSVILATISCTLKLPVPLILPLRQETAEGLYHSACPSGREHFIFSHLVSAWKPLSLSPGSFQS